MHAGVLTFRTCLAGDVGEDYAVCCAVCYWDERVVCVVDEPEDVVFGAREGEECREDEEEVSGEHGAGGLEHTGYERCSSGGSIIPFMLAILNCFGWDDRSAPRARLCMVCFANKWQWQLATS